MNKTGWRTFSASCYVIDAWWEENVAVSFPADSTRGDFPKTVTTASLSPELVVSSCPWIPPLQGDKAVEASAILLFHPNKLDAESEALDPAYSRPRHTHGRLRFVKGEAQLKIISHFDWYGAFH
jgi:hypothetical protein